MTLLIAAAAAVISTAVWYAKDGKSPMMIGLLCWLFWGASIMWFVDAVFEYAEKGAAYFTPSGSEMLNDTFLGLSVVVVALVIWIAALLIRDPRGTVRRALFERKSEKSDPAHDETANDKNEQQPR
ncbi:MAG: hypothetical protein ACOYJI_02390 [Anaerovoracaceae bacterium]|jgi:hypothetical protein